MKKNLSHTKYAFVLLVSISALVLGACKPKTLPEDELTRAVAGTLAAMPQPTPRPTYTPFPTPTAQIPLLDGLFCEYQFCIGHPPNIALFDTHPAENPSSYSEGILASYRTDLFTLLAWQLNYGSDDPQFMLDLVLDDEQESRRGTLDVSLLGDLTVFYTAINTSSEILPAGGAAAWICGDRAFGWKVYAPSDDIAKQLFSGAIEKFRCQE
jgi:hypothetical protein